MDMATASNRKRTPWIWAIFIFYLIFAGWPLAALLLVYSGVLSLNHAQRVYLESLSPFDIGLTVVIGLLNLSGAAALFLLRRAALYLFGAGLAASLAASFWRAATVGWSGDPGEPGFLGTVIGYGISAAVFLYAWKLRRRGDLV